MQASPPGGSPELPSDVASASGWVDVGPVAHGGHCVARLPGGDDAPGRVVFVRHALPGERVRIALTDTSHASYWRADAVEIETPSPDRVAARCPISGPGGCGGCDFQHVQLAAQRRLKAAVVAEQLVRLAGLTPAQVGWDGGVEEVAGSSDGLGWRTRMHYRVDGQGRVGLHAHRSHAVVPLPLAPGPQAPQGRPRCPIATEGAQPGAALDQVVPGGDLVVVDAASGVAALAGDRLVTGESPVTEHAAGRRWQVGADGFWQIHPAAADTLVEAVLDGLQPRAGERAFDLYCGVGLFAGALADAGCRVWGIEASRTAIGQARRNLADVGARVRFSAARVDAGIRRLPERCDLVVLDPPRTGAGSAVLRAVVARRPRAIAYVACDPAALARDLATAARSGYGVRSLRAFDLFPMTHHVECVAVLEPSPAG